MRKMLLGFAACSVLACTTSNSRGGGTRGGDADSAGFLVLRGDDTAFVERFRHAGDSVTGALTIGHMASLEYRMHDGASSARLDVAIVAQPSPGELPPRRSITAELTGDRARLTSRLGGTPAVRDRRSPNGSALYTGPSIALLERALRRAIGDTVRLVILPLGDPEQSLIVRRDDDSVVVVVEGNEWRLAIGDDGRVAGGSNVTRGWTVHRIPYPPDTALVMRPSRFMPAGTDSYGPPAGAPYRALTVTVPAPAGHALEGTLTFPDSGARRVPAVLFLSGSSPQDRDMSERGSPYRPFRQFADSFARVGIASLRLDDRGVGRSGGVFHGSTTADRANDMRAALAFLRARPEIDPSRIVLVGLSEGGAIAPIIAAEDPRLRGIVLLAAPGDSGLEVARYQTGERVRSDPEIPAGRRDSAVAHQLQRYEESAGSDHWARWFLANDPAEVARRVRVPALIVQGETDRNVPPTSPARLAAAMRAGGSRDVTIRIFPDVNHALMRDPDGHHRRELYLDSIDVAAEVVGTVVNWVVAHLR